MKGFGEGRPPMELIEERESTWEILSQSAFIFKRDINKYSINPSSRYFNVKGTTQQRDLSHLFNKEDEPLPPTQVFCSGLKAIQKAKSRCQGFVAL